MAVNYTRKGGRYLSHLTDEYRTGRAYMAAHLEIECQLANQKE
ncbi:hypothetical protein [Spirosoma harenae]